MLCAMKLARPILLASLACTPLLAVAADDEDQAFRHLLTLVQTFTSIAAQSNNPERDLAEVLAGGNEGANRAAAGLLQEITAELPPATRTQMSMIGADLLSIARRGAAMPLASVSSAGDALQARRDLTAMGLKYHDASEFLDAVKRDDALAVELFIAGKGVNLSSRDWRGRSAADLARANGNERLAALLSRSLPAAR
jgi:hypothetical protein